MARKRKEAELIKEAEEMKELFKPKINKKYNSKRADGIS